MLVTNDKPQGYNENDIYFMAFAIGEVVNTIDWLENISLHVYDIEE